MTPKPRVRETGSRPILLFTGEGGEAHGYSDGWGSDGSFRYFGEGQVGDMQLVRGNRAIADHAQNSKSLLLFQDVGRGQVRYLGEFSCAGFSFEEAPDREDNPRRAIVFQLVPLSALEDGTEPTVHNLPEPQAKPLSELRTLALEAALPDAQRDPVISRRRLYERSAAVRRYVLARALGRCEGCGSEAPFRTASGDPYLEPHHIRRLSDGGPDDPRHVAALCPNCHRRVHSGADGAEFNAVVAQRVESVEVTLQT